MELQRFLAEHRDHLLCFLANELADPQQIHTRAKYMLMDRYHLALSTYDILGALDSAPFTPSEVVNFVTSCYDKRVCQFAAYPGGDGQLTHTFYCFQILLTLGKFNDVISRSMAVEIQQATLQHVGATGETWNDTYNLRDSDTRVLFTAVGILTLLEKAYQIRLEQGVKERFQRYVTACYCTGQFMAGVHLEQHAANTYCCVSTLSLLGANLNSIKDDVVFAILRLQKPSGGFCGRPEKHEDSCYSQWNGQTLRILGFSNEIVYTRLAQYDLGCFSMTADDCGGFGDAPYNEPDLWHTHYVLSYLSGLGSGLRRADPIWDVCVDKLL